MIIVALTLCVLAPDVPDFKRKIKSAIILVIPALQLYFSAIFAEGFFEMDVEETAKTLICVVYPIGVVIFKSTMERLDEDVFDVGDLLECYSLVLADLPYRTLYFDITTWSAAIILFTIKFIYKIISYPVLMSTSPWI